MPNKKNIYQLINYSCIAIMLLHPIFFLYTNIDGLGRLPFIANMILCFVCITTYSKKVFTVPYVYWWMWTIYAIINTVRSGGIDEDPLMFYANRVLSGAIVMTVSAVEFQRNTKMFLKFLTTLLLIYGLLGLKDFNFSLGAHNMDMWEHGISDLGNMLPITLVYLCYIVLFRNNLSAINKKILFIILAFIVATVITAATRKAFVAIVIILVFSMMNNLLQTPGKAIKYLFILLIGYFAMTLLLENSFLGNRFTMASEEASGSEFSNNWFLSAMGDRAIMYVGGWKVFLDNIITGIGLRHYLNFSSLLLHSEYMVQFTECGLIGFTLFISLYIHIIKGLICALKIKNMHKYTFTCIGVVVAILFMSFTAWTYEFPICFITLGIVIGYTETILKNKEYNQYENRYTYK